MLNLPDIEPLDFEKLGKPLGPGYDNFMPDPYIPPVKAWDLYGRKNDCNLLRDTCQIESHDCVKSGQEWMNDMKGFHDQVIRSMESDDGYEKFGDVIHGKYHSEVHSRIGGVCSSKPKGCSFLYPQAASARDPIFYRWHLHLDELLEKYKDKNPYTRENFTLSDGLKVLEIKTILDKKHVGTKNDIENTLVTYQEKAPRGTRKQNYNKINHKDFKYLIKMENRKGVTNKVIVRIWLALGNSLKLLTKFTSSFGLRKSHKIQ